MGTEKLGYSVVILLTVSLVLSMLLIASPVSATSATPPSSSVLVPQGGVFLLRGSITFDKAATGYFFYGPVYWYNYGNENENFTLENTPSVYWSDDNTPVENIVISDYAIPDGWQVDIADNGDGISRNGTFYIDIYLRAEGNGGTLHAPGHENIYFAADLITYFEPSPSSVPAGPIDVDVTALTIVRGVQVIIDPSPPAYLENENGRQVVFNVTVNNTGNVLENFQLTRGDNAGWTLSLDNTWLLVPNGENSTTKLTVNIPTNAIGGTFDNIWVKATSKDNAAVFDNKSCLARVKIARGVDVQVTPSVQESVRRENVTFTVTVKNTGNVLDNYALTVSDNENWGPTLDNNLFINIAPSENIQTTLRVTIPDNAVPSTEDNITVTATSGTDNTIKDNDTCIVRVAITHEVKVSISPGENSAFPGENVTFTVTVMNKSDNSDNFVLHASDNLQWGLSLADNLMENIAPGGQRTTKLTVSIPDNAAPDAMDNLTVTAASMENENVTDNATCIAHPTAIARGVTVSISPAEADGMPGDKLSYTVAVTNTGNVTDNYDLTVNENAGWDPSISEDTLEVPVGENLTATLGVTVPDNAAPGTSDRITVTVTSQENGAITASASCVGRALLLKRVEVSISPGYRSGSPNDTLYFVVYVTNAGRTRDSFDLRTSASGGWFSQVEPPYLTLDPDESENVTLSVLIPSNAKEGDTGIVEARAVSISDRSVQGADTCRAIVLAAKPGGVLSIPWIQILLIAALIAGVVFTVGYLTRRRGREGRRGGKRSAILDK